MRVCQVGSTVRIVETPEGQVAKNVRELRDQRRLTVRGLSALLGDLGHPILPSGITKVEDGSRRVDIGDLVALALALGVNPNRLLLPAEWRPTDQIALTPAVTANVLAAWAWADGEAPLLEARLPDVDDALDDFMRYARPARLRVRDQHTAHRAAQDVAERIRDYLAFAGTSKAPDGDEQLARSVRLGLERLRAEIDDLLGGSDGER